MKQIQQQSNIIRAIKLIPNRSCIFKAASQLVLRFWLSADVSNTSSANINLNVLRCMRSLSVKKAPPTKSEAAKLGIATIEVRNCINYKLQVVQSYELNTLHAQYCC